MINKYCLQIWYVSTLLFTGALLLPHLVWKGLADYSISLTQLGPLCSTLLMLKLTRDKVASFEVKRGLRLAKQCVPWYVLSALIPLVLTGLSAIALSSLFENHYKAWPGTPTFYLLNFVAILLGSMGEEIGWRGYLLPALNKKASPLVGSIIVGCLWGFWHLNYSGDVLFWLLFIVTTVEVSIILTFLLAKANGNLWTAIILHAIFNFTNRVFLLERFTTHLLMIEIVLFGLLCAVIVAVDKAHMFRKCTK